MSFQELHSFRLLAQVIHAHFEVHGASLQVLYLLFEFVGSLFSVPLQRKYLVGLLL